MSAPNDVTEFLNSLLVTDRRSLTFLYQAVFGQQQLRSLEQGAAELATHVRRNSGSAPPTLKRWLRAPGSLETRFRQAVMYMAGFYKDESVTDDLLGVLNQSTFAISHRAAVAALAHVQGVRASRTLTDLLWQRSPSQWHVRETAILRELGRMGWTSAVPHLLRALGAPHDNAMREAARALARFPVDDVLSELLDLVEDARQPRQAAGAADALGHLGDQRAIPALQRACRMPDPLLATAASVALARIGDPGAEARLVSLAYADRGHTQAEMRERSMRALGILTQTLDKPLSSEAINTLYNGLGDSMPEVRSAAAEALGLTGRAATSRKVAQVLPREASPLVRMHMIRALGRLGHQMSKEVLLSFLRKNDTTDKIEVLLALSQFKDPTLAQHITPYRRSSDPRLVDAANRALRRLLYRPFAWPKAEAIEQPVTIELYELKDARQLLLPPPPPPPEPGFFGRLFGAKAPAPPAAPTPLGTLELGPEGLKLNFTQEDSRWSSGSIDWSRRFSLQITREPVQAQASEDGPEDIGVHFVLRQREGNVGAKFASVTVSLWCAPSESMARLTAKSERFPCLDPHKAEPLMAALRWYMELHGEPMPYV